MSYAPAPVVDPIDRLPLPFGLLSVLTPRPSSDVHVYNGVQWEPLGCAPASGIGDPQCDPDDTVGLPKNFMGGGGVADATPFTVYGSYECSPAGHTLEYAQQRAVEHLLAREEARVEQAIWTGDLGNGGFAPGADEALSGAVSVARAVAVLEGWIRREYGSLGVIHMTPEAAIMAFSHQVIDVRANRLVTKLGTPVVAGAGYPGTDPDGASAAGHSTLYATPALLGYRSEPFPGVTPPASGLDRNHNDLFAVAERTYVVGWDPCGTAFATADLTE